MARHGRRAHGQGVQGRNAGPNESATAAPDNTRQGNVTYDGPSDTRGRSPSNTGQPQPVRAPSHARSGSRGPGTSQQGPRTDPAKDPPKKTPRILLKNVDFGGAAYNILENTGYMSTELMLRPGFGKLGKPAAVNINSYPVTQFPTKKIYQCDVVVGSGDEKRGLIKVAMESKALKDAVGPGFIFDGNKIAWSPINYSKEIRLLIDLDAEKGQTPRINKKTGQPHSNTVRVRITKAKEINLELLRAYVEKGTDFSLHILECINFMDHLLRETPKNVHISLRRSYFSRAPDRNDIFNVGQGIEAMRGVYQSLRYAEGKKLIINVDVSNSCFWNQTSFVQLAYLISGESDRNRFLSVSQMKDGREPPLWQMLRRLSKNRFQVKYGKQSDESRAKIWTMNRLSSHTAKTHKFDVLDTKTNTTTSTTLFDYFLKKYGVRIDNWQLPLVESNKPGVLFPMDVCYMCAGQRYPYKLNENQTAAMIKFAVSRPPQRRQAIEHGLNMLNWEQDPMLKGYEMKISRQMLETKARVLDPPEVQYKTNTAKPAYSGRWDLRGKVFFKPNEAPLKSWGVVILSSPQDKRPGITKDQVLAFLKNFINLYQGHGGVVANKNPVIIDGVPDAAKALETAFTAAGNQAQFRPQMLMVILPNKSAEVYHRVKKNMDCRWGVMSQCVQASHVAKNQPQYCSNVLMKLNCKLGGTTCTIKAAKPFFNVPTMVIGADVTHAAPGGNQASIAALCVSMDQTASRFAAGVQTNGFRVEMIQTKVIEETLRPLIQHWMNTVSKGQLPKHVYYFRDGVSEGQFGPMRKREVADMQRLFETMGGGNPELVPKFTVVVCEKRHHIRFFPKAGLAADKNQNPVPGVIVDHDVTHPRENDIYLCSHAAIQGTARPTHYYMIMDQANVPVDEFQKMLYQHCYQYQRATTPVSLYPAVYYAHLAAARAIAHVNKPEMDKWAEAQEAKRKGGQASSEERDSQAEVPALISMENKGAIRYGMWYI